MLNSIWGMLLMSSVAQAVANSTLTIQNCKEWENHVPLLKRNKSICLIQACLRAAFSKIGQSTSTPSLLLCSQDPPLPSQPPPKSEGWLCHPCLGAFLSCLYLVSPLDFLLFSLAQSAANQGIQKVKIHIQNLLKSSLALSCCLWSSRCVTLAEGK